MDKQLIAIVLVAAMVLCGCSHDDVDPNVNLNAPLTKKTSVQQADTDRGLTPEQSAKMAEPPHDGGGAH